MIEKNAGKVWAGSYSENYLIINGSAVPPVVFEEDDQSGSLREAIEATGIGAAIIGEELFLSSANPITIEGHLPNGVTGNGFPAIGGLDGGVYG